MAGKSNNLQTTTLALQPSLPSFLGHRKLLEVFEETLAQALVKGSPPVNHGFKYPDDHITADQPEQGPRP